jgi:hypothetical protein
MVFKVIREVTMEEARACAARLGDHHVVVSEDERFYEVESTPALPLASNN